MNNNFENIHFKWTFRKYQQRVLDEAKTYLEDNKIHIVAAPGERVIIVMGALNALESKISGTLNRYISRIT